MDESWDAFRTWYGDPTDAMSHWSTWQAAIKFERERLAKLADDRKYPSLSDAPSLTADEIRAGKISD